MIKNKSSLPVKLAICFGGLLVSVLIGICAGTVWISPTELLSDLLAEGLSQNERIVLYIRLPRILATVLAGSALAVSGALIQAVLGNPLAAPNIIGVNAGAGLFTVLCIAVFPTAVKFLPAAAFAGALFAVLLVYGIAKKTGASRMTIVLAGVGVSSLLNAVIDTVTTLYPDSLSGISSFKVGGVAGITLDSLFPAWILIGVGILAALCFGHDLDVLSLGENTARSLGMNVSVMRFLFLAIAAMLAGAAVSFSGLVGFVGLVVPHISRKIVKSAENTAVLPICVLIGGAFLTLCDTVARTLFAPFELPLGIVVSYIGVPFFIWLLLRKRGGKHGD
ncbi:MAG: iron ABC transporter permease [Clostridia bacterium]|nr:iron ABC transporter permease [Clostridia bacterium]